MCNEASQILQLKVEFRFHTITAFRLYVGYSAQLKGRGDRRGQWVSLPSRSGQKSIWVGFLPAQIRGCFRISSLNAKTIEKWSERYQKKKGKLHCWIEEERKESETFPHLFTHTSPFLSLTLPKQYYIWQFSKKCKSGGLSECAFHPPKCPKEEKTE